jgi:hypothetical protein
MELRDCSERLFIEQNQQRTQMKAVLALTTFLLLSLALHVGAQDLPVVKGSEAALNVGKNVEVRGLVVAVYTSKKGNTFLNFGAKYPAQTFTGYIPAGSELTGDRWTITLQGKVIGITGTVEMYQGEPEVKIHCQGARSKRRIRNRSLNERRLVGSIPKPSSGPWMLCDGD